MENSIKEYERISKLVGSYLGWFERAIESAKKDVDASPIGFWKKLAIKRELKRMSKNLKKSRVEFYVLIDELGALMPVMNEEDFKEHCLRAQSMIMPLYAKVQMHFKALKQITTLVNFTRGRNARD